MNEPTKGKTMSAWFWYAVAAAVLYGLHQIFTKLAADRIGDGLGGFVIEATAAGTILIYLVALWASGNFGASSSARRATSRAWDWSPLRLTR